MRHIIYYIGDMPLLFSYSKMTKNNLITAFQCWLISILSFLLVESILDLILSNISGLSFLEAFREITGKNYTTGFHLVNMIIFSMEMAVVVVFYMFIRNILGRKFLSWFFTSSFFILLTLLFLGQMINLGIYPLKSAVISTVSNMISFPFSVFIISVVYEKTRPA